MATSTGKINFSAGESPSVDEFAGGTPTQTNILIDAAGAMRIRPGISAWADFPAVIPNASPVIGACLWTSYLVYVCLDRTIWALIAPGYVVALSDATAATQLDGALRPVFATTRTRIVIAGGGKPQKWEGAGLSARLGGSPPNFSHVTTISRRLVGNDSGVSGLVYYSEVDGFGAGHEEWSSGTSGAIEAESRADPCIGLYQNAGELAALGTETIQMLSPDPTQAFTTARTIDVGWGPPLTYAQFDDGFIGIDSRKRAVSSDGRSLTVLSPPAIGEVLDDVVTSDDAWGMRYSFGNYDLACLSFPTHGRTFVYDKNSQSWTEWAGVNATTGQSAAWAPTCGYFHPRQRITLVGLATGQIAMLDKDAVTDLGAPITATATSTFEDHGTTRLKHCKHVRFKFHRGSDPTGTAAALYSYRDQPGAWSEPHRLDIGDSSVTDPVVTLDSLGNFRMRQHRIQVDGVAWRFAGMEMDFEVLGN